MLCLYILASVPATATVPVAETASGVIPGVRLDGVSQWLGLRYATASRWQAPVDFQTQYAGAASKYGPNCPQKPGQVFNASYASEDCLYIQGIWAPDAMTALPLPVMVWFHGGGFAFGGGSAFNGSTLARRHGVVVMTVNYRLGAFGFTALREDAAANATTGNWGLLDQQSALRWVRRHAAAFGGAPHKVTIFGQSAGGSAVSKHLVMPGSRGLFDRAIIESGAIYPPQDLTWSLPFALSKTDALAKRLGCIDGARRDCLLQKSVDEILTAQGGASTNPYDTDEQVSAVVDGITLPARPDELIRSGQAADVPLMLGANTNDSTLFTMDYDAYANLSSRGYAAVLNASLYTNGQRPEMGALQRLLRLYPAGDTPLETLRRLAAYGTDSKFICPAKAFAAAVAGSPAKALAAGVSGQSFGSHLHKSAPVYLYHFDHIYPQHQCKDLYFGAAFGVPHTMEVSYVFGQPTYLFGAPTSAPLQCAFQPAEQRIADEMGRLWVAFARDGVPHAAWPAYSSAVDANVVLADGLGRAALPIEKGWRRGFCPAAASEIEPVVELLA